MGGIANVPSSKGISGRCHNQIGIRRLCKSLPGKSAAAVLPARDGVRVRNKNAFMTVDGKFSSALGDDTPVTLPLAPIGTPNDCSLTVIRNKEDRKKNGLPDHHQYSTFHFQSWFVDGQSLHAQSITVRSSPVYRPVKTPQGSNERQNETGFKALLRMQHMEMFP